MIRSFSLTWSRASLFLRSFWWIVDKNYKIRKNLAYVSSFLKLIIAISFSFWTSSFWFRHVSLSISNTLFRELKIHICLCSLAVRRRAIDEVSFSRVLCVSFLCCYKSRCHLYKLTRSCWNNRKTRCSYNVNMWLIYCIIRMTILDICKRRI